MVDEAFGGTASVVNIGAGTGSYEVGATVLAVEPSQVMIAQRPATAARAVRALAVLTVHDWRDVAAGVGEMLRVARRTVAFLTWDASVFADFWLVADYLPAAAEADARLAVPVEECWRSCPAPTALAVPVPHDCDLLDRRDLDLGYRLLVATAP